MAAAVARTRGPSPRTGVVPPGSDHEPSSAVRTERNPATSRAPPTGTAFLTPAADHAGGSASTVASRPVAPAPPAMRCPPRAANRRAAPASPRATAARARPAVRDGVECDREIVEFAQSEPPRHLAGRDRRPEADRAGAIQAQQTGAEAQA